MNVEGHGWRPYQLDATLPQARQGPASNISKQFGGLRRARRRLRRGAPEAGWIPFAFDQDSGLGKHARRAQTDPWAGFTRVEAQDKIGGGAVQGLFFWKDGRTTGDGAVLIEAGERIRGLES